jgi:hypothetical protein
MLQELSGVVLVLLEKSPPPGDHRCTERDGEWDRDCIRPAQDGG